MRKDFRQESDKYWKQLPVEFEGGDLVVDLQAHAGLEPDWELIADFEGFMVREGVALKSRVHEPLKKLAAQIGFSAEELESTYLDWVDANLLYEASVLAAKSGLGPVYELRFSMQSTVYAWFDTYGLWIATFQGLALTGLRRENF